MARGLETVLRRVFAAEVNLIGPFSAISTVGKVEIGNNAPNRNDEGSR